MSNQDKPDKRQLGRVSAKDRVEVSCNDFEAFKFEYAENISVGGMYLVVKDAVSANTEIAFTLNIKDINQDISGKAIVVWTKEFTNDNGEPRVGLGLKFLELEGGSEAFIKEFVEKHVD